MRSVRFIAPDGYERVGRWQGDLIVSAGRTFDLEEVRLRPPSTPTKIIAVAPNYIETIDSHDSFEEPPDQPGLFLKPPNAAAAHLDEITLPGEKDPVDVECELGVVIGTQARSVSREDALEYVEGYTVVNDMSNREDMDVNSEMFRGKGFDSAAPMGPALVPPTDVPTDATLQTRVNGEVVQDSSLDNMIWSVAELIEEITRFTTLEPGDVIASGTPPGWHTVDHGDEAELEIEGIGVLKNTFRREAR